MKVVFNFWYLGFWRRKSSEKALKNKGEYDLLIVDSLFGLLLKMFQSMMNSSFISDHINNNKKI